MKIVPIGLKAANEYVTAQHRHHKPVRGCKFCVSVENESGECCGVAICGRPISRYFTVLTSAATRTNNQRKGFAEMQSLLLCPAAKANAPHSRPNLRSGKDTA